jgi:hypothetical protein
MQMPKKERCQKDGRSTGPNRVLKTPGDVLVLPSRPREGVNERLDS